jgi:hypothetical protein
MYSREQVLTGLRNPQKAVTELRRRVALPLYLAYAERVRMRHAVDPMTADWDNLVVLDACRYDLFREVSTLPGTLERVVSPGTGTDEFLRETVEGRSFPETVYLTANPHLHFRDARFHDVDRLWATDWDDDLDTVPPAAAVERTIEAHDRHPNKRLVAHLVQPHYPFIGERGRELERRGHAFRGFLEDTPSVFHHLERGTVDREEVWAAYCENLELALPHAERLLEALPGKTVVTADHGNAFGEWGIYGHGGPKIPALVDVPWLVAPWDERKVVEPGEATVDTLDLSAVEDGGVVEDRLRHLGYA